jgi:hypothetical protein
MFNPKKTGSSLASLFGGGGGKSNPAMARRARESELSSGSDYESDGSDGVAAALTYQPVKQPRAKLKKPKPAEPKPAPTPAAASSSPPSQPQQTAPSQNSLAWNCTLYPFKLENGAYVPQGGGPCGCVIMGGGTSFNLLIYDQNKTTLCLLPLAVSFEYTLQDNLYANFYDKEQNNWSVRFQNSDDFRNFALYVSVIKFHTVIHGKEALLDRTFDEVLSGNMTVESAGVGDGLEDNETVDVQVSAWLLPASGSDSPCTALKGAPLPGTGTGTAQPLVAGITGGGPELVGGIGKGLLGMKVGEEKLILVSPALHSNSKIEITEFQWVVATVRIEGRAKTAAAPPPLPPTAAPSLPDALPQAPVETKRADDGNSGRERSDSVKERMARVAQGAGGYQAGAMAAALGKEAVTRRNSRGQSFDSPESGSPPNSRPGSGRRSPPPTNADSLALVVHGEEIPEPAPPRQASPLRQSNPIISQQEHAAHTRRPSRMPQQSRRQSFSPNGDMYMDGGNVDMSYPIQMLQMSSTSVERMVRDMEAKVDKLLRMQDDNPPDKRPPHRNTEGKPVDGEDLLDRLNAYINETKKAKADAAKHLEKSSNLQMKVSELLEKNQDYVTTVIELREKHNATLKKLSEASEAQMNNHGEVDSLREQLAKMSKSEEAHEAQRKELEDLKTENAGLRELVAKAEAEATAKLNSALDEKNVEHEKVVNELKEKIEKLVNAAVASASPPNSAPPPAKNNNGGEEPNSQAADAKIKELESELEQLKAAQEALREKSAKAVAAVKEEASSKMLEVVKKKTQKVMGHVYKQAQSKFTEGPYDTDAVMGSLKEIITTTTKKMFA